MGRFHRHEDGTWHEHDHGDEGHDHGDHEHHDHADVGDNSGYDTGAQRVDVLEEIFAEDDRKAAANRALFDASDVVAVNLMSSPGAGKTTLLRRTLKDLADEFRMGVIEGDIATSIDADRLAGYGAQISLLNTGQGFGGECHLDAPMVAHALTGLNLATLDLVLIENVGNLVCPAEFDVGAHHKAMVFSVTEGEDKPLKYPVMFAAVELVVLNKVDLLPYVDFDEAVFDDNLRKVNPGAHIIRTCATKGDGLTAWYEWLRGIAS
jgi:hydrogenase nickel incorporation protein HypB